MNNKKKMMIFIICYLAYTLIYVARLNFSMASDEIRVSGILDTAGIGLLGGVFSVVYAFGRLINGYIGDIKSPRFMITTGLLIVGIANLIIAKMQNALGLAALWGLNAFAQSMLWGPILKVVASLYDEKTAKKKTSYMVTSVATGNIIGIVANTKLIEEFGFKYAFIIPGIAVLIMCTIVVFALGAKEINEHKPTKKHISMIKLFEISEIKRVIFPAFFHGMLKDNISVWMTAFYIDRFGVDLKKLAGFVLFIPIIGFIGRLLYPACYKLSGYREHTVSVYALAVAGIASLVMCFSGVGMITATLCLSIIYAAVSIVNTSILSMFPLKFAKSDNVASVSGIMDFATYFGAGVSSFAYGYLIENFGYLPMYASWVFVSVLSILILLPYLRKNAES